MSSGIRVTVLALVAFAITLGVLLWPQRDAHQQLASRPAATEPAAVPPAVVTGLPLQVSSAPAPPAMPPQAARAVPREVGMAVYVDGIPVPALVSLNSTTAGSGGAAVLRNVSDETLDITVMASNPATGHQASVQVTLDRFRSVKLDQLGLVIEQGDHLTLHSPPYVDREVDSVVN